MVSARRAETRWVTRIIPFVLGGLVGFTIYVVTKHICVDFFLSEQNQLGTAIAFLVLHFVFLLLMLVAYFRVFLTIQYNPGVTPLGPSATEPTTKPKRRSRRERDLEAGARYEARPDNDPDSPGLEAFYSKDVFVCETDGRPRWCSTCCNWKLDRVHHSSELERCVRKMDHYCPWVGGIVAETSFKFFVQFTCYTAIYCIIVIVAAVISIESKSHKGYGVDGLAVGVLAIASLFGLFTLAMTLTSARYMLINLTTVDYLKAKNVVYQLAIRVPRGTPATQNYSVITYPLPKKTAPASSDVSRQTAASTESSSPRDQLATRTFAIVKTERGENPWHLGYYRNWTSVMGRNPINWLLPFNESPCARYESNESFYEMGPLYPQLRARFGLPDLVSSSGEEAEKTEMKETTAKHGINGMRDA